jgi:hypothetical protein
MAIIFGKDGNSTGPSIFRLYNLYMIMIIIFNGALPNLL